MTLCVDIGRLDSELDVRRISPWLLIDQSAVDAFADLTGDHAFIHTDPVRAAQTTFGGTIAHGLLLLSLLPQLKRACVPEISGAESGVMAGFDRVRFVAPVAVGDRVRATFVLSELNGDVGISRLTYDVTLESEAASTTALSCQGRFVRWHDVQTSLPSVRRQDGPSGN